MKSLMAYFYILLLISYAMQSFAENAAIAGNSPAGGAEIKSQWQNKRIAFLGDSITDKCHVGTTKNYWQYLEEILGLKPAVYGINGDNFCGILKQAKRLKSDGAEKIDAIMIFAGTNDYNGSVPIGQWYKYEEAEAPIANGKTQIRKRRIHIMDSSTFKGRINAAMAYIKENFPDKQIILITPIHRGFAKFGEGNVQPDESFPNRIGEYIDSYVDAVKEAGNVWAVPVIDLNSLSGLFPNTPSHAQYFHKKDTDLLHPNAKGHEKMASAIAYALLAISPR